MNYCAAGWPLLALREWEMWTQAAPGVAPRAERLGLVVHVQGEYRKYRLMLSPVPIGFGLDTAFYACMAFTVWSAPGFVIRGLRRARGRCASCSYDRSGLPPGAPCPECAAKPPRR
jgi:hypothetical protein